MSSIKNKQQRLIKLNRRKTSRNYEIPPSFESSVVLLKLDIGKRYAHTASSAYHLTMASLQPDDRKLPNCACNLINKGKISRPEKEDKVIVIIEHDLKEYILCILDNKELHQCKLNLIIQPGEQVAFRTIGKTPVMLTGKLL